MVPYWEALKSLDLSTLFSVLLWASECTSQSLVCYKRIKPPGMCSVPYAVEESEQFKNNLYNILLV